MKKAFYSRLQLMTLCLWSGNWAWAAAESHGWVKVVNIALMAAYPAVWLIFPDKRG